MGAQKSRKVKVTVLKKLDMRKIHEEEGGEDPGAADWLEPVCPGFKEGQEFIINSAGYPEGFCQAAFVDIFRYVHGLRSGANYHWMKKPGTVVACCSDGLRPVVFKLERLE